MPRDISSGMLDSLLTNYVRPCFLLTITFASQTINCWTGVGDLIVPTSPPTVYIGIGDMGTIGQITEASDVQAYGTTVTLSNIDTNLLSESLTDIQLGAPATLYFALLDSSGTIYGNPYPLFSGTVDKPTIHVGVQTSSITIALENRLSNLQRASTRRYTAADQNLYYPGDTFFNSVESLNDLALIWAP